MPLLPVDRMFFKFFSFVFCVFFSFNVQAESLYQQAEKAWQHGHSDAAISLLQQRLEYQSEDYQAWFLLGVAQVQAKHLHQAIEAFRQVIILRADLAEPHVNLAVIYNELDDVDAAVFELQQALKKHPEYAVAEENLADLYIKLALQHYKNSLQQQGNATVLQRYKRLLRVRDTKVPQFHIKSSKVKRLKQTVDDMAGDALPVHVHPIKEAIVEGSE